MMQNAIGFACKIAVPLFIVLDLFHAPYTKVEESFNIQAVHDILTYGTSYPTNGSHIKTYYDHIDFPGAVPRTFVGAVALTLISYPVLHIREFLRPFFQLYSAGLSTQILVRLVLAAFNYSAIASFQKVIKKNLGQSTERWFTIFQATQFHIIYYASRTLPNMFAFGLTTYALKHYLVAISGTSILQPALVQRSHTLSIIILTIAGVVFRSELAVLVASQTFYLLLTKRINLITAVRAGLIGSGVGLALTIPIDSYFWQNYPLWPEWVGFYYNTVLGKSSDWGISPWHYYFTNSIPKLLFNPFILVLIPVALALPGRKISIDLILPSLLFVSLYSILPHKEWRFVIYIVPSLTAIGAMGASWISDRHKKSLSYNVLNLALIGSVVITMVAGSFMLSVSSLNYPGGHAMSKLYQITSNATNPLRIHVDNLACQTGVTRFLENRNAKVNEIQKYSFDKTDEELKLLSPSFWAQFDYALVEHQERAIGSWEIVDVIAAYDGIRLIRPVEDMDSTGSEVDDLLLGSRTDIWHLWDKIGQIARKRITAGWWVSVRVSPKIKILKRNRPSLMNDM